jgi:hypothetical protein
MHAGVLMNTWNRLLQMIRSQQLQLQLMQQQQQQQQQHYQQQQQHVQQ